MKQVILMAILLVLAGRPVQAQEADMADTISLLSEDGERPLFTPLDSFGSAYSRRHFPDSLRKALLEDEAYWYANAAPQKSETKTRSSRKSWNDTWLRTVLWFLLVGCFLAVMAWWLFSSNISLFRKPAAVLARDDAGGMNEDIFSIDYDREIGAAVAAGNYRLAIRLHYLKTLRNLASRNIIEYRQERTNSEYLAQLSASPYHTTFWKLTRSYEYTWYGQFVLSAESFGSVQQDFINFNSRIS